MLPPVQETLDRRRNERANDVRIAHEQILMDDDAVADNVDADVGEPQDAGFFLAEDFDARHVTGGVTAKCIALAADEGRTESRRVNVDDVDLGRVDTGTFDESRPLLEYRAARVHGDGFAFEVLRSLDGGFGKHHDGGWPAPENAADGLDGHPFGDAIANHKAVRKTNLCSLAGNQLRSATGTLARADRNVEPGLAKESLLVRDHEADVGAFVKPVQRHRHRLERIR